MAMSAERRKQFTHVRAARTELLAWAVGNAIPLAHVEFNIRQFEGDDTTHRVRDE
jgi:hypothetical protein